jgi:prevent-host-death family protein
MRRAGIREARQNLTALLEDVKKGREIVIADRGRPVAMLVPVAGRQPFPDLRSVRRRSGRSGLHLSQAVLDGREDR